MQLCKQDLMAINGRMQRMAQPSSREWWGLNAISDFKTFVKLNLLFAY